MGGENFRTFPDRPWCPPSLLYDGYWVFLGGKERQGRDADPSPPSSTVVKKEQSYISTPSIGRSACTEPQCLYSTAIPVLPLWVVRPVQSLSTCTVQLYLYSPYVPYGLYRASVPVQYSYTSTPLSTCTVQLYLYSPQCLYSTAITPLPLWAVQPVQRLSACTMVHLYLYLVPAAPQILKHVSKIQLQVQLNGPSKQLMLISLSTAT